MKRQSKIKRTVMKMIQRKKRTLMKTLRKNQLIQMAQETATISE